MSSVAPGWYRDPAEPSTQRYWDGEGWVGPPIPADATPPEGPPPVDQPAAPTPTPPASQPSQASQPTATPPGQVGPGYPPPPGYPPMGHPQAPGPAVGYPPMPPYGYAVPEPRPHGYPLAPLGARLVARLIDIVMVLLLNIAVNGWFVWQYLQEMAPVFAEIWRRAQAGNQSTEGLPMASERASSLQMAIILIAAALWWAYEVPATANTGQTLGKRIMGIRVVRLDQDVPLGFGRSFRRWNTLGLPTLLWVCCVGFFLQFIDSAYVLVDRPLRQALHDKSAQTVVVWHPKNAPRPFTSPGSGPAHRSESPGGSA
ncbi:MAG TPA: RDD family protein [Micromonospora sp.]